ncbi:MAG: purine/pyrimidine permease [Firmicutes bacterium]|nr:purine/pyrimidine permease [Bacillota bacterium]
MKYKLDDNVPAGENLMYAFQQVVLFVASAVVMPVVVGYALGLSQGEVATTLQRTFVLCGVMTLLQVNFGHRFPIQDGPAGLWSGLFLIMAATMPTLGMTLPLLRGSLELGLLIAGGFIMILSITGLIDHMAKLFTPLINGLLIILMVLQISASIMKGMLGVSDDHPHVETKAMVIAMFTMVVILLINLFAKGFIRTIATFIGMVAGWILASVMGVTEEANLLENGWITLPKPLAWGPLHFDPGVTITCIIGATVLLSMAFASINGMGAMVEEEITPQKMRKTIFYHGMAAFMTGLFSSIAFMPYVSSIGVVEMTGVAARKPLNLASIFMILMGLAAPFGALFATIPSCVGNGALIIIFALCIGQGLREFEKVKFESRENLIVGLSTIIGVGFMFLPSGTFAGLPSVVSCLLSNGLIVGMGAAFLLEHVIMPKQENRKVS